MKLPFFVLLPFSILLFQCKKEESNPDSSSIVNTCPTDSILECGKLCNVTLTKVNSLVESWSPYKSVASLLLWKSIEEKYFYT